MQLKSVTIQAFRSIRDKVTLNVEPKVTVVLGANDHGKTNALNAIHFLNRDLSLSEDDLNWDDKEEWEEVKESFPRLEFEFELEPAEGKALAEAENAHRAAQLKVQADEVETDPEDEDAEGDEGKILGGVIEGKPPELIQPFPRVTAPKTITMGKKGVPGTIFYPKSDFSASVLKEFFKENLPRVEIIKPTEKLVDSVTAEDIAGDENEFMRGILYYAGLDPLGDKTIFERDDVSQLKLKRASEKLNATIKSSWTQGKELQFLLSHDSENKAIELLVEDPAVKSRYVRVSRRSSGFTHFFALKTILHARQTEYEAKAYIFLFDEPGIFLHPAGQHDLIQVLETLGQQNQIIYVTHSIFMINRTFPCRHRLIIKGKRGTHIEGKPYVGRWSRALDVLGLTAAGNILFANHVLLAEGETDSIYIHALLQKLATLEKIDVDINSFSVIQTSQSRETDTLIRILSSAKPCPKMAVLFDGDDGGKARLKDLNKLLKEKEIESRVLSDGTAIEDHLIGVDTLYVNAVARYIWKLINLRDGSGLTEKSVLNLVKKDFLASGFEEGKPTEGVAGWADKVCIELAKLSSPPSKVGIAREYVLMLDQTEDGFKNLKRPQALAEWIKEKLGIPGLIMQNEQVLGEEAEEG